MINQPMLKVNSLTVRYGKITILDNLSFSVDTGQWLMLVGPNGAGKSTAVGAITQTVQHTGEVFFDGTDVKKLDSRSLSRRIGVLTQSHFVGYSFTVGEIVRLGRYAYSKGVLSAKNSEDEPMVQAALKKTGMTEFENQSVLTLSGGELQRAFLAQVFAQNPHLLILDEPTNHLDLVYQKQVFELISEWIAEKPLERSVISVVHDLSLAKAYGTHALLLSGGKAKAFGKTADVLTAQRLNDVYSMDVGEWMRSLLSQW